MIKATIIIFFISIFGYSQDCKYDKNEIDSFSKDTILETKLTRLGKMHLLNYVDVFTRSKNKSQAIGFYIHIAPIFSISKGDKFILLDDKGETYSFLINDYKISDSRYDSSLKMYFHTMQIIFPLFNESKDFFKNKNIIKVRLETSKENFDFDVKEKDLKKVIQFIKCTE
jgi:hypothetical protein